VICQSISFKTIHVSFSFIHDSNNNDDNISIIKSNGVDDPEMLSLTAKAQ